MENNLSINKYYILNRELTNIDYELDERKGKITIGKRKRLTKARNRIINFLLETKDQDGSDVN